MQDISQKLQLKTGYKVLLLHAPQVFAAELQTAGCQVTSTDTAPDENATYDAVQLFVKSRDELRHYFPLAVQALKTTGLLWVAYPKKSSKVKSVLTRDNGWEVAAELGYAAVRQVSLDETWSSLRFKHSAERSAPSSFGVDSPGIDRRARTVEIPEDLREALESIGLLETFERMAFTHRKEFVLAILEAKRPETRANRIGKIIEQVLGYSMRR
jgi:hypothetical protein